VSRPSYLHPSLLPRLDREAEPHFASPARALSEACHDTLGLLFRPFDWGRWFRLSAICLFLGGGTASAAFNWSLGSLPGDIGLQEALGRTRTYISNHLWLVFLISLLALGAALAFLYLRAILRFVLVGAILRQEAGFAAAWRTARPLGRSYFWWLLAVLFFTVAPLSLAATLAFAHFRVGAASGYRSLAFWMELTLFLLTDVVVGLALALLITVTDDLVVPIMYSERLALPGAWRRLWGTLRKEAKVLAVYVLLRFVVAVAVGVAALFLLFPILVTLFSGAVITGALVVLALRLVGVIWIWNPLTVILASLALILLTGLVLVLMSIVGMPGQVLIQDFGIRFVAARVPSLSALSCLPPTSKQ